MYNRAYLAQCLCTSAQAVVVAKKVYKGDSYEAALENIKDAIRLHLEDRIKDGEAIPMVESISLTSLEVAV